MDKVWYDEADLDWGRKLDPVESRYIDNSPVTELKKHWEVNFEWTDVDFDLIFLAGWGINRETFELVGERLREYYDMKNR